MNSAQLESEIRSIAAEALEIQLWEVTMWNVLGTELQIGFLDLVIVLVDIEREFKISIPLEFIWERNYTTVSELVEMVCEQLDATPAPGNPITQNN